MPCILDLGNPALRPRHWEKIFKKINLAYKGPTSANSISLTQLEGNGIFDVREYVSEVSANASGEFALEQSLEQVIAAWADLELPIMNHRNQKASGMKDNIDFHNEQLKNSVSIVRMKLTKNQRVLMGALIVLDVHGITVLENLLEAGTSSLDDFDWSKQLRYYWIPEGEEA
eukprot:g4558.t1